MQKRTLKGLGWDISEIGFGAWAIGGDEWGTQQDEDSMQALRLYLEKGGNFIDTAQAYGNGHSERLVGQAVKDFSQRVYIATKLPPKNGIWNPPSWTPVDEAFPKEYIVEGVEFSLRNLGVDCIDIYQLHTWCETWNIADHVFETGEMLKKQGKIRAFGISTTESFPEQVIPALQTGTVNSLQFIFNLFEQHPAYTLLPTCVDKQVMTIARVPFDESSLTGKYQGDETFQDGDFRQLYFRGKNLKATVQRVEAIREWKDKNLPDMSMAELALRWVLSHDDVDVVIPGMRNPRQVELNTAPSDGQTLTPAQMKELAAFAWRRNPWMEDLRMLEEGGGIG